MIPRNFRRQASLQQRLHQAESAVNRILMRAIAHAVASNLNSDFFTFFGIRRNCPLDTGPTAGPKRECPTRQPSDRLRLPGGNFGEVGFPAKRLCGIPFVRIQSYTFTDDQESETARSVYCPGRNGLLYSRRSTPTSPFGVVENRARALRSNLYPLHGRAGSRP